MQFKKIKKIAQLITGYTFRGAIKSDSKGDTYVLQAQNIKNSLTIDHHSLDRISIDASRTKAFAQNGDVAFSVRGLYRSSVIQSEEKILVSSSVYLLRLIQKNELIPEYLSAYLNSSLGQQSLMKLSTGAAVQLIIRKDLENLEIPILPINKQKLLAKYQENIQRQQDFLERKIDLQKKLFNNVFQNIAG